MQYLVTRLEGMTPFQRRYTWFAACFSAAFIIAIAWVLKNFFCLGGLC